MANAHGSTRRGAATLLTAQEIRREERKVQKDRDMERKLQRLQKTFNRRAGR